MVRRGGSSCASAPAAFLPPARRRLLGGPSQALPSIPFLSARCSPLSTSSRANTLCALWRTLLRQSEVDPLSSQSLAHSLRVYPGYAQERSRFHSPICRLALSPVESALGHPAKLAR